MITESILTGLFGVADLLLGMLPEIEWTMDTSAWSYLADFLSMIAYLLPWGHIVMIASLLIAIAMFRATMALLHAIRNFIPFI